MSEKVTVRLNEFGAVRLKWISLCLENIYPVVFPSNEWRSAEPWLLLISSFYVRLSRVCAETFVIFWAIGASLEHQFIWSLFSATLSLSLSPSPDFCTAEIDESWPKTKAISWTELWDVVFGLSYPAPIVSRPLNGIIRFQYRILDKEKKWSRYGEAHLLNQGSNMMLVWSIDLYRRYWSSWT